MDKVKEMRRLAAVVLFPMLMLEMQDSELLAAGEAVEKVLGCIDDHGCALYGFFQSVAAVLDLEANRRAAEIVAESAVN